MVLQKQMKSDLFTTGILAVLFSSILIAAVSQPARVGSQNSPHGQLLYLHYENSSGDRGLTTFDFDEQGRPALAAWEKLDGSLSSLNRLSYDEHGNLVRKYREFSDGTTSEELYEYNAEGRLVKETFGRSDSISGATTYEYNAGGNLTKAQCAGYQGWFHGELVYTWAEGRATDAEIYRDGKRTGEIWYDYDAEGRLLREHWQVGKEWSQTLTYEYQEAITSRRGNYSSANVFIDPKDDYAVAGENYSYSGESGGPSFYGYESGGKLVIKRFVRSDGLTTNTFYLYDADRKLTRSYRVYADGRHGVFSYKFNDAGRLIERTLKISDGGASGETYEYSEDGKLTGGQYENVDAWLSGTLSFEYTGDLLNKGVFKGETGFDAEITFGHDEPGHLVSIHWEFSYGGTQTYTFKYAPHSELPAQTALTP